MIEPFGEMSEDAEVDEFVEPTIPDGREGAERERQLEVELARLHAEIADLKGDGAVEATSRFLALAAGTIDVAMAEAQEETDRARAQAADLTAAALAEVVEMRSQAESEALALVETERGRVADEIDALQQVRSALESERHELEDYHTELRRRVQELAESMVAFMTTETPIAAMSVIGDLTVPELAPEASVGPTRATSTAKDFAGVPVLGAGAESEVEAGAAPGPVEAADIEAETVTSSMFSRAERRTTESRPESSSGDQPVPNDLAELVEEQRFRAFIGGDEDDKSRNWLLRHEGS